MSKSIAQIDRIIDEQIDEIVCEQANFPGHSRVKRDRQVKRARRELSKLRAMKRAVAK